MQKLNAGAHIETLGHEIVGTTEYKGKQKRVAVNPLVSCGLCDYCKTERSMFCRRLWVIGRDRPGALAGPFEVPRSNVVFLPEALSDPTATLADPYAVIVHGSRLNPQLYTTKSVIIIGDGVIAVLQLLHLVLHAKQQARYVVLCKTEARAKQLAYWYATLCLKDATVSFVDTLADDAEFDGAIETVGRDQVETFTTAVTALTPRGSLVHYGVYPPETVQAVMLRRMMYKEIHVQGVNSYANDDFIAAVAELAKYQPLFETIIGDQFPFASREDAIEAAYDKMRPIAKKIIIKMEQL
jgi:threonine dehydrogenase-like Zn-dependent dehydrogenase